MTFTRTVWRFFWGALLVCGSLYSAGTASAQIFTPTYMSPAMSSDLGIYVSDGPGDFALEGIWRQGMGGMDLGLRAGLVDVGDAALTIGGELRTPLGLATAPLNVAITGGIQGMIGEGEALGIQAGLSVGHTFIADQLALTPYIHPRIAVINGFAPDDDGDVDVLADVGLDVDLSSGLSVRLGIAISDVGGDFGVGLAWR